MNEEEFKMLMTSSSLSLNCVFLNFLFWMNLLVSLQYECFYPWLLGELPKKEEKGKVGEEGGEGKEGGSVASEPVLWGIFFRNNFSFL